MDHEIISVIETDDLHKANGLCRDGKWIVLEIYKRKRQVEFSKPVEFEEYPVYIVGEKKMTPEFYG